ncbi:MAG: hypothetical protein PPP58_08970 [Natronomonas sp.]
MDDRGRVPFALVGVLLLVSSVTLVVAGGIDRTGQPSTERALEAASGEVQTAVHGGAAEAAAEASVDPVTQPADTVVGGALSENRTFRDALELRIYLAVRERIDGIEVNRGETTATAVLPRVEPTTSGYQTAIDRVHVERAGDDGAALRVRIDDLKLVATREGSVVERVERETESVVSTPVLSMHDRTERFDERLDASVLEPGLSRRLTTRLYPLAWMRGYAQYGGAPISTVVGTRHVELATNDALIAEQRAVFGDTDPGAERGIAAAGRRVATTDLLAGLGKEEWTDATLKAADVLEGKRPDRRPVGSWREEPDSTETTVEIGPSAEKAYSWMVGFEDDGRIHTIMDRAHTVEARLVADDTVVDRSRSIDRPPSGWERIDVSTSTSHRVLPGGSGRLDSDGWTTRRTRSYRVIETETTTEQWEHGNETTTTESIRRTTHRVTVAKQARTPPIDGTPQGRLDGKLRSATERAVQEAIDDGGGSRQVAVTAISGRVSATGTAEIDRTIDEAAVEADLRRLRDRSRSIETTVSGPAAAAGRVNAPAALRERLDERRSSLQGEMGRTPEKRTLRGVRTAYLEELDDRLAARERTQSTTNDGITGRISEYADSDTLDGALAAHRAATRPDPEQRVDPAGNLSVAVDTSPSYLPTDRISRDRIDVRGGGTVTPMATRNVNLFSSPHEQLAGWVFDSLPIASGRVNLGNAARTLQVADETEGVDGDDLEAEIEAAIDHVEGELVAAAVEEGIPESTARRVVRTDAGPAETAIALADGTATERIVSQVDTDVERDHLRIRLDAAREEALADDAARPPEPTTSAVEDVVRDGIQDELEDIVVEGLDEENERARTRVLGERLGSLPAGLPILPTPTNWYATANVWYVESGGRYERFSLRANRGGPAGAITYVRDGSVARIDHGGEHRRLGTNDRVTFRTKTAVVVVVPPGGSGVGDTDGIIDEKSPGWPP